MWLYSTEKLFDICVYCGCTPRKYSPLFAYIVYSGKMELYNKGILHNKEVCLDNSEWNAILFLVRMSHLKLLCACTRVYIPEYSQSCNWHRENPFNSKCLVKEKVAHVKEKVANLLRSGKKQHEIVALMKADGYYITRQTIGSFKKRLKETGSTTSYPGSFLCAPHWQAAPFCVLE